MFHISSKLCRLCILTAAAAVLAVSSAAQGVKRLVIMKVDGVPNYYVDRMVRDRDPATGRSRLPWIEEVFYKNGSRMVNFYTRGMSLSAPAWSQLDTGQHLQLKGNVEFDRYILHSYDYLNFVPFYVSYGLNKRVDMPAVEVLDQLGIPILADAFLPEKKYTSPQLLQRGNDWGTIAGGFMNMLPRTREDAIDEWTLGFQFRDIVTEQNVRDIAGKLVKRPEIDYFDYCTVVFDHASHHFNDPANRYEALREIDRAIGTIWTAIRESSRAGETALVMVSDHGFNSEPGTFSQGFNLVKLLSSAAGGGHHVVTKRRLMLDYSIKGMYPFVPLITTTSNDSFYLKGESTKYPTALVDFDGNERSSIHLRENDLNVVHILFKQLKDGKMERAVESAAVDEIFRIIDKKRSEWQRIVFELDEELDALHRWVEAKQKLLPGLMMKPAGKVPGERRLAESNRRLAAQVEIAARQEKDYRHYLQTLTALIDLRRNGFNAKRIDIERLVAPGVLGGPNSISELQNYVIGVSAAGLSLNADGKLDLAKSFRRVNYFDLFARQTVRTNVQANVGSRPVDFAAVRIPLDQISRALPPELRPTEDAIWLYGSDEKQGLLLTRSGENSEASYRYLPVSNLRQDADGRVSFRTEEWGPGFPLRYFEDAAFATPISERATWLSEWHGERDWLNAVHKTLYSIALIGLNEQIDRHPISESHGGVSEDERLIARFRQRQRRLTEADMLVMANNHWNFDVRGFNPGGNHGSFFRVSTNSTFMVAGGADTGIPRGLVVERPYDGLSFMPTVLRLMGKIDDENRPITELSIKGFQPFPGRVVSEIIPAR